MTRTSLQRRSARGSAAETAASPPTRTKSSISVVTNKTFKANALVPAVMILMQEWVQLPYMLQRAPRAVVPERTTFLSTLHNLGSRPLTKTNGRKRLKELHAMTIAGNDQRNLTGSFAGLRVLDFSTTIAGPHCTRMLADMAAEVIKIETEEGETMRTRPPVRNNCSTAFGQLNVGKNSLVLNLKSRQGAEAVRRLVATADVLVENFRPGVMRRLKLDHASLRELNPKLIYCSISGYGQTGPSAELPAYAPVIHAASGYDMAHLAYQPGRSRPDCCGIYLADVVTGIYAFGAISAALYQRRGSQKGQYIDVSMLESMLSLTLNELQWSQFEVRPTQRPMFGPVETANGYVMLAIASEKAFQSLVMVAGHPASIADPRFAIYAERRDNWADLMNGVELWSRTLTTERCLAELNGHGVPCSAYRTV